MKGTYADGWDGEKAWIHDGDGNGGVEDVTLTLSPVSLGQVANNTVLLSKRLTCFWSSSSVLSEKDLYGSFSLVRGQFWGRAVLADGDYKLK